MIHAQASITISRSPATVFEYVAEGFFRNYPNWSPEVLSVQAISEGPVKVGTRGKQVRLDMGVRTECEFRISRFEPGRRVDFRCISVPLLSSYLMEASGNNTRLTFIVEYSGSTLLLGPFRRKIDKTMQKGSEQVVSNIKALLESAVDALSDPAGQPVRHRA